MIRSRLLSRLLLLALTGATASALGCDGADPGTLDVRAYGEDFIEDRIPADVFSDGWSVKFDRFLLSLSQIQAAAGHGEPALSVAGTQVVNLAQPTGGAGGAVGILVGSGMVSGGTYDHLSYRIGPPVAGAAAAGAVPAGALEAMIAAGESIHVEGRAEKPGAPSISFAWGFTRAVSHVCHTSVPIDGGTAATEITIHGDHLFYDDLLSETPMVAFDLIATSDTDADGTVTPAELRARDISTQARYQVGSTGISNLWDFIAHQATTVGHVDGEGHCNTAVQ